MKQKSKRVRSMAAKVRSTAKKLLKESDNTEMTLAELQKEIEQIRDIQLRSDYVRSSLEVRDSGFEIHLDTDPVVVSLKNSPKRKEVEKVARARKAKSKKLNPEEFTLLAIQKLSGPPHKAIHSVYSGFNAAFRKYFSNLDPVEEIQKLVKAGKVRIRPSKGGVLIFAGKENTPAGSAEKVLAKMGLQ